MPSRPVFVTAYFTIYPKSANQSEDGIKQFNWRLEKFRQLLTTGIQIVLFTDNVAPFVELLHEYSDTFRIGQSLFLSDTDLYRDFNHQIKRLPDAVNSEKDTAEFMWVMMLKNEFLERAIRLDLFQNQSSVYAWIDFSISYIFKNPEGTLSFLKTLGNSQLELDTVYIPGCWGAHQTQDFDKQILWRFCGGIIIGDTKSLLEMNRLVNHHMPEFLRDNRGTLTWEVNYWAWMEYNGFFHPTWYYADHDDWMVLGIPSRACIGRIYPLSQQVVLSPAITATLPLRLRLLNDDSPLMKWSPSSACFFKQSRNEKRSKDNAWILVRYVNYRLDDYGSYIFPDSQDGGVIKNENVLHKLELDENGFYRPVPDSFRLTQLSEAIHSLQEVAFPMSVGLEDVRLWENQQGNTCYISTNVSKTSNGMPQIATGVFQTDKAEFSTMTIHQTDLMQKNWIPWTDDEVIYKWCLDGIVFRHLSTGDTRLVPFKIHNAILSRVRGSSIFITGWNAGERVAVVHYSEEGNPRKYYHLLVVLQEKTGELLRHTLPFYLGEEWEKHAVNFCIGFDWTVSVSGKRLFHFWFSEMDRDPKYWVVEEGGGFQWCNYEEISSTFYLDKIWYE